jgi:hypothetical protein
MFGVLRREKGGGDDRRRWIVADRQKSRAAHGFLNSECRISVLLEIIVEVRIGTSVTFIHNVVDPSVGKKRLSTAEHVRFVTFHIELEKVDMCTWEKRV